MIYAGLLVLFLSLTQVFADVAITAPDIGQSFAVSGGQATVQLAWKDDGNQPALSDLSTFTFVLCSGPNTQIQTIGTIMTKSSSDLTSNSISIPIQASAAASGVFFIQIYAVSGSTFTIHYTNRFTLTGMTGSLQPIPDGGIDTPPSPVVNAAPINTASFTLAYTQQTGVSRFAPMQTQPGSVVTVTTWSRRFPTSAVTYYTTFRSTLDQITTLTPGWSYSVTSDINYATPAAMPSDNGGWYDPKDRLTFTPRKINIKRLAKSAA